MTPEIALILGILAVAVALFVTEVLRVDVVALLVLLVLAISGLVPGREALSGFSNPAVITVWAVFILSGGLAKTGVASIMGRQVLKLGGGSELRLIALIMVTAGVLSAFMNNVGVAALMLPVVMDIARRTAIAPSKLLMPLSFSCLLGGLTTLIGTPPNILVSESLRERGLEPFGLFDFTPVGTAVMVAGIVFIVLAGRHLLPKRDPARETGVTTDQDLRSVYGLREQLFVVGVPADSGLAGHTLAESRIGSALGVNVIGIVRAGGTKLAPTPDTRLEAGDRLVVQGRPFALQETAAGELMDLASDPLSVEDLMSAEIQTAEIEILAGSSFIGETLRTLDFRNRYGAIVLADRRAGATQRRRLETLPLRQGDVLFLHGTVTQLDRLREDPHLRVSAVSDPDAWEFDSRMQMTRIPEGSPLAGRSLVETRLGSAYGIGVLGIGRGGETMLMPGRDEVLRAGDVLLVRATKEDIETISGLHRLSLDTGDAVSVEDLESDRIGLAEVVLSPRSRLRGKSMADLRFREKYGLNAVAISRGGEILRRDFGREPLRLGDALLLHGPREKLELLVDDPDLLVLTEKAVETKRLSRAPVAALVMAAVVVLVLTGVLPIYIAAVAGAVAMVLAGCLTMDEAYRAIEWPAVFLIAGMLPLGLALQSTGAAAFLTEGLVGLVGDFGPLAVMAALFLATALGAQVMPTSAVAILMAPIALRTAADLGLSSNALVMTVALSASASFMSPVAHPANILVMGPGGYRFIDYIKVGLPLTLVCLATALLVLPIVWPLAP